MFVALEGPDGAGKSTLAAKLQEKMGGAEVRHFSQLQQPPLKEYVLDLQDYLPNTGLNLICDRWSIGEDIYGPLYRDKSALSLGQRRWIALWGLSRGASLWHVTQPLATLQERLRTRGEDYLQDEHVAMVHTQFERLTKESPLYGGDAVPDEYTLDVVADEILRVAEYNETRLEDLCERFPSFVGDPVPSVLLVGEKRGGEEPHPTTSAFLPVNGNSGNFLMEALDESRWRTVALCNGVEEGDNLPALVDALAGPRVVALGRAASDALMDQDIEHAGVPHPQHVRRFHNKKRDEYGTVIDRVINTGEAMFSWPR